MFFLFDTGFKVAGLQAGVFFSCGVTRMAHMGRLMMQCVIHLVPPDPECVVGGSSTLPTARNKTGWD